MSEVSRFSELTEEFIIIDSWSEDDGGLGIIPSPVGEDSPNYIVVSSDSERDSEGELGENSENQGRDTENWSIDQYFAENEPLNPWSPYRPSPATSQEMSLSSLRRQIFGPDSPLPLNHSLAGNVGPIGPGVPLNSTPLGALGVDRAVEPATAIDPETVTWTNASPTRVRNLKTSVKFHT